VTLAAFVLCGLGCALMAGAADGARLRAAQERWRTLPMLSPDPAVAAVGLALAVTALVAVAVLGRLGVLLVGAGLVLLPRPLGAWLQRRRAAALNAQLPDALETLANALRVGQALPQAFAQVTARTAEPLASTLQPAAERMQLGEAPAVALRAVEAETMPQDWGVLVAGVAAVGAVGGNLAGLFETAADLLRRRERVRQRLQTLTAQARMQMAIIAAMPVAFLAMIRATNPRVFAALTDTALGWVLLAVVVTLALAALRWARRIMAIEC